MKTINNRNKTARNLLAFAGDLQLPRALVILSHCTRPCHLRDMPKHLRKAAKWLSLIFLPFIYALVTRKGPK